MKNYDIIVIGAGSGGLSVGLFMARLKMKVLMIDRSADRIGGECLNDGCIPSKALIHVAKWVGDGKKTGSFGFTLNGQADMKAIMNYIHSRQDVIRKHENAAYLKNLGIDFLAGEARFENKSAIRVNNELYSAKKIILATGSRPKRIEVPGIEKIPVFNNENIFELQRLPLNLTVLGAGATGLETAQSFQRLGSNVTVIDQGDRILSAATAPVSAILQQRFEKEGICLQLESDLVAVLPGGGVKIRRRDGTETIIKADALFVATGRTFDFAALGLEEAGIIVENGKIRSDKYLRTSNRMVWLCGDVAGSLMFSHAAEQHARLLLNNFFSPFKKKLNNDAMSWVVFTDPEVAAFGLSEKVLEERNLTFQKLKHDFSSDDRAVTDDYRFGRLDLFLSKKRLLRKQYILGGSMICPNAGEMVQELILAMQAKTSVLTILKKIYPYPVAARVNQAIIAQYKSKQLTPYIARILRLIYRFG